MKISRRSFLAYSGGTALTLYVYNSVRRPVAMAAPIPGGTLNPSAVPKFLSPLIIPPAMPIVGAERLRCSGTAIYAADPAGAVARDDRMELRLDD